MKPAFSLLVITPSGVVEHTLPTEGRASIGRAEGCTIRLDDGSVSRHHAALHVTEDGSLRIEDLGAANGTQVHPRGSTIAGETESLKALRRESLPIAAGDRILLGSVSAVVVRRAHSDGTTAPPLVRDPRMKELYAELERAAASSINVLLLGETGAGKEVLARELHARSRRAAGPFLAINCAALPESLLEAELFGHEKGAFTGANQARPGLFESANGGSLFIDEVGELPSTIQAKLLRVLEERKVVRLGSRTERSFDARYIAATNRDLEAAVESGQFRSDLYFRLAGLVFSIPPLRERRVEILPLASAFLQHAAAELDRGPLELTPEAQAALQSYAWPGNVRELKNAMQRAAALARGVQIFPEQLPERLRRPSAPPAVELAAVELDESTQLRARLREVERARLVEVLERCTGNQTRAAKELGISRRTLVTRLQQYELPRPRKT